MQLYYIYRVSPNICRSFNHLPACIMLTELIEIKFMFASPLKTLVILKYFRVQMNQNPEITK